MVRAQHAVLLLGILLVTLLVEGVVASSAAPQDSLRSNEQYWRTGRHLAGELSQAREVRALVEFDVVPGSEQDLAGKDIEGLREAFFEFLGKKHGGRGELFQSFRDRPFMALDLNAADLEEILESEHRVFFGGRNVRVRVEAIPMLRPAAITAPASIPLASLLTELGDDALGETGKGSTVIVIDSGVTPTSDVLHGTVVDGSTIVETSASCTVRTGGDDPWLGKDEPTGEKRHSHGTRVAGLVSAIAPGAELVSIRVGDATGAATVDVIAALQEVCCRWSVEHPVVVAVVQAMTSTDVSGSDDFSNRELMEKTIRALQAVGIPVIISAGNDSFTGGLAFPADLVPSVSVGGVGRDLSKRLTASNWDATLDLCAPAKGIGLSSTDGDKTYGLSGTSFSPPFVAGVLARLKQRYPTGSVVEDFLPALEMYGVPIEVMEAGVAITVPRLNVAATVAKLDAVLGTVHATPEPVPGPAPDPGPEPDPAPEPEPGDGDADACTCDGSCGCECGCGTA